MEQGDPILKDKDRAKLDGIVMEMAKNNASQEEVQFVVNDFKSKYGVQKKKDELSSDTESDSGGQSSSQDLLDYLADPPEGASREPKSSGYADKVREIRPVARKNPDGRPSTVLMESGEWDGKNYAYPTLFPKDPGNVTEDPSDWIELSGREAQDEAIKRGEVFEFDTPEEADAFAKGSWKKQPNIQEQYFSKSDRPETKLEISARNIPLSEDLLGVSKAVKQDVLTVRGNLTAANQDLSIKKNRLKMMQQTQLGDPAEASMLQQEIEVQEPLVKSAEISKLAESPIENLSSYDTAIDAYTSLPAHYQTAVRDDVRVLEKAANDYIDNAVGSYKDVRNGLDFDSAKAMELANSLAKEVGAGDRFAMLAFQKIKNDSYNEFIADKTQQAIKNMPEANQKLKEIANRMTSEFKASSKYMSERGQEIRALENRVSETLNNQSQVAYDKYSSALQKAQASIGQMVESEEMTPDQAKERLAQINQDLFAEYDKTQTVLSEKLQSEFSRGVDVLEAKYQKLIQDEWNKASKDLTDEEKQEMKAIYGKAYSQVLDTQNQVLLSIDDMLPEKITWLRAYTQSLGRSIAASSASAGSQLGVVLGNQLMNANQVGADPTQDWEDLIDMDKLIKSSANLAGSMTISMGATAGAAAITAATGGGALPALGAAALAGWGAETLDMAGQVYTDKLAETGSEIDAMNSSKQMLKGQLTNMWLYTLEGLPIVGKSLRAIKNPLLRIAAGGSVELGTEFGQEYRQGAQEKAIREFGDVDRFNEFLNADAAKETFLNIAPVFLLGGGGQVQGAVGDMNIRRRAKIAAAEFEASKITPEFADQKIMEMTFKEGPLFSKAVVSNWKSLGYLSEAEAKRANEAVDDVVEVAKNTSQYGLNKDQTSVYFTLHRKHKRLQREAEGLAQDASMAEEILGRAKEAKANAIEFLQNPKTGGKYSVVKMGDKTMIMDEAETMEFIEKMGPMLVDPEIATELGLSLSTQNVNVAPVLEQIKKDMEAAEAEETKALEEKIKAEEADKSAVSSVLEGKPTFDNASVAASKGKSINDQELQSAINEGYEILESLEGNQSEEAEAARALVEDEIEKLEAYDNLTKTETRKVAEERTVQTVKRTPRKTVPSREKNFVGKKATFSDNRGAGGRGVVQVEETPDGREYYVLEQPNEDKVILGRRDQAFSQGEVNFDSDGNPVSVTFPMSEGKQVTVKSPEIAQEFELEQMKDQEYDEEVFEETYIEFTGEEQVEVPVPKAQSETFKAKNSRSERWVERQSKELPASNYNSEEELSEELESGRWATFTAENPNKTRASEDYNAQKMAEAEEWLREKGYGPDKVSRIVGVYGSPENSFMVKGISDEHLMEFMEVFGQESVATNEALIFNDGRRVERVGDVEYGSGTGQDRSIVNVGGRNISFSIKYGEQEKTSDKPTPGNRLFSEPLPESEEIAKEYMEKAGMEYRKPSPITKIAIERAKLIAEAFDKMKDNPSDPEVRAAYEAMVKETIAQFEVIIARGYKVEVNNSEPYSNSTEMIEDLRSRKTMKIFSTESGFGDDPITEEQRAANPLLQRTEYTDINGVPLLANDIFRFVHDFFGHAKMGNGFGPIGEENAWNVHARMYSPLARRAMTTETRGQNSWVNFSGVNDEVFKIRDEARRLRKEGKTEEADKLVEEVYEKMSFAEQKVGLLPIWASMTDEEIASVGEDIDLDSEDSVLNWLDKAINATDTKGKAFDATLGTPLSVLDLSLKAVRALHLGGKPAAAAINEVIQKLKENGYNVNEDEFTKRAKEHLKTPITTTEAREAVKQGRSEEREKGRAQKREAVDAEREKFQEYLRQLRSDFKEFMDFKKERKEEVRKKINEGLKKDFISRRTHKALITAIARAETPRQFERLIERIDEAIRESRIKEQRAVKSAIKKLTDPKKTTESRSTGTKKGKVDNQTRLTMKYLRGALDMDSEALESAYLRALEASDDLTGLVEKIKKVTGVEPSLDEAAEDAAARVDAYTIAMMADNSVEGAYEGLAKTKEILKSGRAELKKILKEKALRYEAMQNGVVEESTGGRGVPGTFSKKEMEDANRKWFKRAFRAIDATMDSQEGLRMLFDKLNKLSTGEFGGTFDELYMMVANSRRVGDQLNTDSVNLLQDKMLEIYGSPSKVRKAINENLKVKNLGTFKLSNGKFETIKLSQNQAYQLYNMTKNEEASRTFSDNHWTQEMLDAIENFLTPEVKKWADWQVDEFYPMMYGRINPVYKKLNYMDMGRPQNFAPIRRRAAETKGKNQDVEVGKFSYTAASVEGNSMRERVQNSAMFDVSVDGDSVLYQYMSEMNHYVAFAETIKMLNAVFTNPKVKEVIKLYNSESANGIVDDFIKDIATQGKRQVGYMKIFDKIRGGMTTSSLALAPNIFIKQMTSGPAFIADIGFRNYAKGIGSMLSMSDGGIVNTVQRIYKDSPYLQLRYEQGFDRDMKEALAKGYRKVLGGQKWTLPKFLMANVMLGDAAGIAGGIPVYMHYYNQAKKNMSEQDAHMYALLRFEEATKLSQQSTNIEDLSALQRGSQLAKLFTMYLTSPIAYMRQERKAIRDIIRGSKKFSTIEGKKQLWNGARRFAIYQFVIPMLFQYVANMMPGLLSDWDEEDTDDMKRAMLLGNVNGVFILGGLLNFVADNLQKKPWASRGFELSPAFDNLEELMVDFGKLIALMLDEEEWDEATDEEIWKAVIDPSVGVLDVSGLPASRVRKVLETINSTEDEWDDMTTEERAAIIMGYSPYAIEAERDKREKSKAPSSW